MKKQFGKFGGKFICLLLVVVLAISLGACGRNRGNNNNELAKQNVFSHIEIEFEQDWDNMDVRALNYFNDRVHVLINSYKWDNSNLAKPLSTYGTREASVSEAGREVEDTSSYSATPAIGNDNQNTDNTDKNLSGEEDLSEDENLSGEEDFSNEGTEEYNEDVIDMPIDMGGQTIALIWLLSCNLDGSDVRMIEMQNNWDENSNGWINVMSLSPNGKVYALRETYFEDYSDPANPIFENQQVLICWNMEDGSLVWEKPLNELKGDSDYFYVSNMMIAEDGTIYMMVYGNGNLLCAMDGDGNILWTRPLEGGDFENISSLFVRKDGKMVITSYGSDYNSMNVAIYDPATGNMGEKTQLPGNIWGFSIYQGTDTDFFLANATGVYTYNIGDEEIVPFMNFINSDLSTFSMQYVSMISMENFIGVYNDPIDWSSKIGIFTKVNPEDIPDKQIITMGVNYLDETIRTRVIDFNKTNPNYRITVREYSSFNTMDNYMAGYTKLNNDIISGDMPDILVADSNMPIDSYIAKGLIADVGRLIEQDEELSQNEYMDNVFKAYSINDKLYSVIPRFMIGTFVGKKTIIGERDGWNMEEFQALMNTMPAGTQAFGTIDRYTFLSHIIQYCGSDFIDLSTGKCNFDSPEFINMLEFAKTLPEVYEYNYEDMNYWVEIDNQYRENRTVLMPFYLYQFNSIITNVFGYFGEDVTYVGFPSEDRNGSVIISNMNILLSAKSKSLDGAWEFVRYYLTDEYQQMETWGGMPVKKDVFMEKARQAMERPFWIDENNQKVEYDHTWYINNEEVILPPLNQEQFDQAVRFVESVDRPSYYDESVRVIIDEETPAFFTGQKSASEVAKVIQSRVQIYVNENR